MLVSSHGLSRDRKSEISAVDNYYVDLYGLETLINFI